MFLYVPLFLGIYHINITNEKVKNCQRAKIN